MKICLLYFLYRFCNVYHLVFSADASSVKGTCIQTVSCFTTLKETKEIVKLPFFFYRTPTKYTDLNFESVQRKLKEYNKLQDAIFEDKKPPIIALFGGSCCDDDDSLGCLIRELEKLSISERKKFQIPQIERWINATCSQHNNSGNLDFKISFFLIKSAFILDSMFTL